MNSSLFPVNILFLFSIVFVIVFSIKMLLEKNPIGYKCTLYLHEVECGGNFGCFYVKQNLYFIIKILAVQKLLDFNSQLLQRKKINFSCIKAWELGGFRFFFHRPNLIQASSCFPSQSNDKSLFVLQQNYIINSLNVSFFTQVVVVLFEFDQSCYKYVSKW